MIEGILIKGPLTEADIKEFADTMRRVEQKRPHETFMMTIVNELASNKEAAALLNTVFPAIGGTPYDVKTFKRTDAGPEEIVPEKKTIIHRNDEEGTQVEWRGILLTLRPNEHHGIAGSITVKDKDGKMRSLDFHGQTRETGFPVELHEEMPDGSGKCGHECS